MARKLWQYSHGESDNRTSPVPSEVTCKITSMPKWCSRLYSILLACSLIVPALSYAQIVAQTIPEKIEWTWADRPEHPDPALPNVLLIGDSITRAYYGETSRLLQGHANCYLFATSASSGDPRLPIQISEVAAILPHPFAVIHFNNGMHGWSYTEQQYGGGLPQLVATVRKLSPSSTLIWASTTPIRKPTNAGATNARVDERNRLAIAVMQQRHIQVDNQNGLMLQHQDLHQDDVHFTAAGSALQAQQVAELILKALSNNQKPTSK